MPSRADDLRLALELADIADAISLPRFRQADLVTMPKGDGSVVTEVDVAIEYAVRARLSEARPYDAVDGEELGRSGDGPRLWTLDPIESTAAFVQGLTSQWSTLIALVEEGIPVVGVVARPVIRQRWWAAEGEGAFLNGRPLRVSNTADISDAVLCEDFRVSAGRGLTWNPLPALATRCRLVLPWVEGYERLLIAAASADIYLQWHCKNGPDLNAPTCILHEAGGRATDLHGAVDVDAAVQISTNERLHDAVTSFVRDIIVSGAVDPARPIPEDIPAIWRARAEQPGYDEVLRLAESPSPTS